MNCRLLDGENIRPANVKAARALIGKNVKYLRSCDIDRTGRGYIFPKTGTIEDVFGRNVCIGGDYIAFSRIVEMVAA